jgi:dienelactone hydrolase
LQKAGCPKPCVINDFWFMTELLGAPLSPISLAPDIQVNPNPSFVDKEVGITLRGIRPGLRVSILAETEDDDRRTWKSAAEFTADASGEVNVSRGESLGGSYRGISAMGLFWSMKLAALAANDGSTFKKTTDESHHVRVTARLDEQTVAHCVLERRYVGPGTIVRDLKIDGQVPNSDGVTVGRLFIPPGSGSHPVVIVLSGSGGGFDIDKAAVLSRHGFATLALAYFGIEPLPSWLNRIPLEYFEDAINWLRSQPEVDPERIGTLGVSRGAELALLLGATFPLIRAVVAYAPSSVAWAASGRDKATGELIPCWTHRGEPIPFAPLPLRRFMLLSAFPVVALKRPVLFRNLFRAGLRNSGPVRRAAIQVERTQGPILLISGGDDHLWPAAEMSEAILVRLKQKHFPHAFEHLHYPEAGHMLRYPFLPTTPRVSSNKHLRGAKFSFGGNAEADADAQCDSWRRSVAFLKKHL